MRHPRRPALAACGPALFAAAVCGLVLLAAALAGPADGAAIDLIATGDVSAWQSAKDWAFAAEVHLNPENPRRLVFTPGQEILVTNGSNGMARDLVSKRKFGDCEAHIEFLIAKGSNSGVKLHGHYEIQIFDSHGKKDVTASDMGGIYPRAELRPTYHYLDKGVPPRVNAAKPAGEWQTLDITFRAPRFNAAGERTQKAQFVKVVLNGQVIHDHAELNWPTGHNWKNRELAEGPLLLQGDHGPVAFRHVRVRPINGGGK
jgi:hypothetical protein